MTSDAVRENEKVIENRMLSALQIQGTRKFHAFVQINLFQVKASCLSGDQAEFITFDVLPQPREMFDSSSCNVDDYVVCLHPENKKWYISKLIGIDEIGEEKEFVLMLMSPDGESGLLQGYKHTKTKLTVCSSHIFFKVQSLKSTSVRSRMYKINQDEFSKISNKFANFH